MSAGGGRLTGVDRVVRLEPGKGATAIRNVPNTLDVFDTHFPRFPVLPGVLILGSLGSLAVLFLDSETGSEWRMAGAERVRYRHFVQPGDRMEMTVELLERAASAATMEGVVRVDGRRVTTVGKIRLVPT